MSLTSKLKSTVDQPVWEWMRFAPSATAKPSAAVSDWKAYYVGGTPRYAYYIINAALYRYDTTSDSWHTLAAMTVTPLYNSCLEYSPSHGYYGRAIGPGPGKNTIQMAGLNGDTLVGQKIAIIGGTGAGQERTIVDVRDPVIADQGSVSAYAAGPNPATITDAATLALRKTWQYNQWRDYQVRITYAAGSNTGQNQVRKILNNTNNLLTFSDYNYATMHSWYAAPLATAITALATWYQIESNIVVVDSNWTTPPDNTSRFVVKGGGLWLMTGLASGAFYTAAYYDILADVWYYKGTQTLNAYAATWDTTENSMEVMSEAEGGATTNWSHATPLTAKTGTVSAGSAPYNVRTLIDSTQNMRLNQYANQMIKITSGTGRGQTRTIVGNNQTTFIIGRDWDVVPDSTSSYQVIGDSDKIYTLPAKGQSVMNQYSIENDVATTGRQFDFGVARTFYADLAPQGVAAVAVANAGSGGTYAVGDILTLTNNGLNYGVGATVQVLTVSGSQVATVALLTAGSGYPASATAYATTGGGGTGATFTVSSNSIASQPAIGISGIAKTAGGLLSITVNTAGTGYSVNDLLTLSTTGTAGTARVTAVNSVGGVTGVTIEQQGSGYTFNQGTSATTITAATAKNATATDLRAAATGCVINVVSITDVATATTSINHNFKIGDVVNIGGAELLLTSTGQTYYGGLRTVAGVPSTTSFTYSMAGVATSSGSAATLTPVVVSGAIVTAVVNAAGTGYSVGDLLTCTTTGTGGTARVVAVNSGLVTGVSLVAVGSGYSAGSSATTGGGGSGCTITLTVANGVASSFAVTTPGQGFGTITSASTNPAYTTGTGLAVVTVYNGGSGYAVGDLLQVAGTSAGGSGGIVKVLTTTATGTTPAGAVLSVQLMATGSGYATGTQIATTTLGNTYAAGFCGNDGGGTGCTVNIAAVGSLYASNAGTGLLANVSVNSAGAIQSATVAYSGSGYTASAQTFAAVAAAVYNAEALSTTLIVDNTKHWQPNELVGKLVQTQLGGVAATAQMRRIFANSSHTIMVQPAITAPTVGTTKYVIFDAKSLGTEASYKSSDPSQYSWGIASGGSTSTLADAATGLGQVAVIAGGASTYVVGDVLTLATGTGGTVKVAAVTSGAVTSVTVVTSGTGYTAGTTYTTTGGGGSGCTIQVVTTNAKNWDINRWAGYKVKIIAGTGVNSNPNELLIASNTATTLTLATNFTFSAAPDATTVYAIMDNWGLCTAAGVLTATTSAGGTGYRVGDILLLGTGLGGYVKVLTVSAGVVTGTVQVLNPGSGYTGAATVATTCITNANASGCTITTSTVTAAGGASTWNDPYQNWPSNATPANATLVNKMIRPTAGSTITGSDFTIATVANATQLTAAGITPDGNTTYSIYSLMPRGQTVSTGASSLHRLWNTTLIEKARYMVSWRGNNTPSIDRYDIVQDIWETLSPTPLTELYSLGSMFVYNGGDRIYFTTSVTGRLQYYDLATNKIVPCSTVPYGMGAGIQGDRMFVMSTTELMSQSLQYVYIMRHTGQEMWRTLIYW